MSSQPPFADPAGPQPTEEEMRAAYEAQLKEIRVEDLVVESLVSLLNLGGRRAGLVPGSEDERDPVQVRLAIEAVRGLLVLVEEPLGESAAQLREAVSQLQLAYVQMTGGDPSAPGSDPSGSADPGAPAGGTPPASGPPPSRLWVPGQ